MSVQVDLLPVLEDKERQILLLRATQGMRDPFVTYVATVTIKQAADHASLAVVHLQRVRKEEPWHFTPSFLRRLDLCLRV